MFSGMEAASVASADLGWRFVAFAEVDPTACWTLHSLYGCGGPLHLPRPEDAVDDEGNQIPREAKERAKRIKAVAGIPAAAPGGPVNLGDVSRVDWSAWRGEVDVVVGGPPCQAFSLAGMRRSLDDHRGNLSLHYVRAIHAIEPDWVFTENVPGWLNTKDNAFGCYLGALVGSDTPIPAPRNGKWGSAGVVDGPIYRVAWRVLDAQGFVPQRRRRVFVVAARVGIGGDPVRVLFEAEAEARLNLGERADSGPLFPVGPLGGGHPRPGTQAGQGAARHPEGGAGGGGAEGLTDGRAGFEDIAFHGRQDVIHGDIVPALDTDGYTACVLTGGRPGDEDGIVAFTTKDYGADAGSIAPTLRAGPHVESHANSGVHVGVAYLGDGDGRPGDLESYATETGAGFWSEREPSLRVTTAPSQPQTIVKQVGMVVRRLMPSESLSLQGFPTDYLSRVRVSGRPLADGPMYKLCGNSWAVPLVAWVFARLDAAMAPAPA
jgi:DNA (cytosine-5)-methyltransferase 1